jgi:hypothetical protein
MQELNRLLFIDSTPTAYKTTLPTILRCCGNNLGSNHRYCGSGFHSFIQTFEGNEGIEHETKP